MTLAPGSLETGSRIAGLLSAQAASWVLSGASTARPISRTRTGPPLR